MNGYTGEQGYSIEEGLCVYEGKTQDSVSHVMNVILLWGHSKVESKQI